MKNRVRRAISKVSPVEEKERNWRWGLFIGSREINSKKSLTSPPQVRVFFALFSFLSNLYNSNLRCLFYWQKTLRSNLISCVAGHSNSTGLKFHPVCYWQQQQQQWDRWTSETLCQRYIESIFDGDDDGFGGSYALRNDDRYQETEHVNGRFVFLFF